MAQVRKAYNMSAGKPEGERPACRPRYRGNNNVAYYFT